MGSDNRSAEVPGEPGGFLTMRLAAESLTQRLRLLSEAAWGQMDGRADYYIDRIRFIAEMVELADPDDMFEQNAFRKSFTNELEQLPLPSEDASMLAASNSGRPLPDEEAPTALGGGWHGNSITAPAPRNTHPRTRDR